ncbi:hypothetical protein BOTBODRAFT_177166 [Botryobasidium botryosum FD-172 SS1]|uniref:F-box domain-containing protein n=1 Tax=Botryobasidium botryosum (strain FD-172 SS1) TaxID=930990 RepID=A0A067M6Y7_BOTB1|nr:hypothetical protein BOTBODRAFT_177166 [Botryobasidium botryosum FD-172 SS1]
MDAGPEYYDVIVLGEVPPPPYFKTWIANARKDLDEFFEAWKPAGYLCYEEEFATFDRPTADFMVEWVYEIDLDRLTFRINSSPMFRLDCLPPGDQLERYISEDSYGHIATPSDMSKEYLYDWKTPPPPVEEALIDAYRSISHGTTAVPTHQLLATEEDLSPVESAWVAFLEIREFESFACWTELEDSHRALCLAAVNSAFLAPFVAKSSEQSPPFDLPEGDFWWAQADACVTVATHPDDERNAQAAIARLQEDIMRKADTPRVVYGVTTSVQHVVVVRVDKSAQGALQHTPALQFFLSFYTESRSTPGITALARLGRYTQPCMCIPPKPLGYPSLHIPDDIVWEIAAHLTDARDLRNFAMLSTQAFAAAKPFLQYPHFGECLLRSPQPGEYTLVSARFDTFEKGDPVVIELKALCSRPPTTELKLNSFKPLEYEICTALDSYDGDNE